MDNTKKLLEVLEGLQKQMPEALEAAWKEAFNTGCAVTRVAIASTGEISHENVPYEDFFIRSNTKASINTNTLDTTEEGE